MKTYPKDDVLFLNEIINMAWTTISSILFCIVITVKIIIIYYLTTGMDWKTFTAPIWKPHGEYVQKPKTILNKTISSKNGSALLDPGPAENWFQLPDKFERINENIIYRSFKIKKPEKREKVNVIFLVSSAPARLERRMAIRETWWSDCKTNDRVC